ncbi:MAG TPA: biotin carboxylase N-terminal domain-containing protein, partial [Polyangiaceae bacterium]|nr:biotin carboxylase N-terminal domain-containing protein [Polyangiaceae bacterium]
MFKKILIANRGEIALRIIRGCREMGIRTVAVHSQADADALHVRFADEAVCIGPAPAKASYLHVPAIIAAAEISGADAVHPGYGFLSENAEFARICRKCSLTFIGPTPENMRDWGDKVTARKNAVRLGLPLLPGTGVLRDAEHAIEEARRIGFPVMLKASGGGGGRGMQILRNEAEVRTSFPRAHAEALAGFKNGDLYLERYIEEPRHIEFQVLCDGKGTALVLGERECSIQRRHQKLLEEAPSVALSEEARHDMAATIARAMRESGYVSLGTLEFLMDERGELSFMEMNTRIQVEHPVTEMVTGVDLVAEQIRVAAGRPVSFPDKAVHPRGHAIECRINA